MTGISTSSYVPTTSRYAATDRSTGYTSFADQMGQAITSSTNTQSDRLTDLLAQAGALKKQQVNMSNRDYLLAKFTLEEQISAERLKAGEDLDQYAVRFEGRVFKLAGKMYGPRSLDFAKVSDIGMVQVARPEDFARSQSPRSYLAQQRSGVDVTA